MSSPVLVDAGPLVALLDADDQHHQWAVEQFTKLPAPLSTCEAVLAETFYLLRRYRPAQQQLLTWVQRGALKFPMRIEKEAKAVQALWAQYEDVPMSLADACLVRMAELQHSARVFTLDSDFLIYRKNGKDPIPLVYPQS